MQYINLAFFVLFCIFIFICLFRIFSWVKKLVYVTKFQSYMAVLLYHMEKAYDMIHKDHILIYSLEATRPDIKLVDVANKAFCKLTIKFLGPMLYRELRNLYGGDEALLFYMAQYFLDQYESDEIRSAQVGKIAEKENETETEKT